MMVQMGKSKRAACPKDVAAPTKVRDAKRASARTICTERQDKMAHMEWFLLFIGFLVWLFVIEPSGYPGGGPDRSKRGTGKSPSSVIKP